MPFILNTNSTGIANYFKLKHIKLKEKGNGLSPQQYFGIRSNHHKHDFTLFFKVFIDYYYFSQFSH